MNIRFTSKEFNQLGLELAGFSPEMIGRNARRMNLEQFKDFFYASPKTVESLFQDIQHPDLGAARIAKPNPKYLLLALYYLKKYPTKSGLAAFLDSTEKTGQKERKRRKRLGLPVDEDEYVFDDPVLRM